MKVELNILTATYYYYIPGIQSTQGTQEKSSWYPPNPESAQGRLEEAIVDIDFPIECLVEDCSEWKLDSLQNAIGMCDRVQKQLPKSTSN